MFSFHKSFSYIINLPAYTNLHMYVSSVHQEMYSLQITSDLFNTVDDFCSISYRLCFSFFLNIVTQNSLNACHLQVYNELCVLNTVSNQFISGFTNHFLFSLFLSITATSYGLIPKCHLTT